MPIIDDLRIVALFQLGEQAMVGTERCDMYFLHIDMDGRWSCSRLRAPPARPPPAPFVHVMCMCMYQLYLMTRPRELEGFIHR